MTIEPARLPIPFGKTMATRKDAIRSSGGKPNASWNWKVLPKSLAQTEAVD